MGFILVGLWPSEDDALRDDRVRAVIGADYYSTSLRDTVNPCVGAARKAEHGAEASPAAPARSGELVAS